MYGHRTNSKGVWVRSVHNLPCVRLLESRMLTSSSRQRWRKSVRLTLLASGPCSSLTCQRGREVSGKPNVGTRWEYSREEKNKTNHSLCRVVIANSKPDAHRVFNIERETESEPFVLCIHRKKLSESMLNSSLYFSILLRHRWLSLV